MALKIISDGSVAGTSVIDKESGIDLSKYICDVKFEHSAGCTPKIKLTFLNVLLDLEIEDEQVEVQIKDVLEKALEVE